MIRLIVVAGVCILLLLKKIASLSGYLRRKCLFPLLFLAQDHHVFPGRVAANGSIGMNAADISSTERRT